MKRILPASFLILIGLTLIAFATYPFLIWQFYFLPKIKSDSTLSPIVSEVYENPKVRENLPGNMAGFSEFFVSIPSLRIEEAKVKVETSDFLSSLAHYPGSALPGEEGNVFITGHSILPQFFSPRSYLSIFSTLYTLNRGDQVSVSLPDSSKFDYVVIGMAVVGPDDTWVLKTPDRQGRYLSLLTCTPPGFKTERLVVLAKQVS